MFCQGEKAKLNPETVVTDTKCHFECHWLQQCKSYILDCTSEEPDILFLLSINFLPWDEWNLSVKTNTRKDNSSFVSSSQLPVTAYPSSNSLKLLKSNYIHVIRWVFYSKETENSLSHFMLSLSHSFVPGDGTLLAVPKHRLQRKRLLAKMNTPSPQPLHNGVLCILSQPKIVLSSILHFSLFSTFPTGKNMEGQNLPVHFNLQQIPNWSKWLLIRAAQIHGFLG